MKITGGGEARGVRPGGPKRQAGKADGPRFADHLGGAAAAAATESASGGASVAALLAVQAAGDALEARKQAYDRAEGMLKKLDALHLALLEGRLDDSALTRLAADMERQAGSIADPELAEVVAEIELRAAVELAKRGLG